MIVIVINGYPESGKDTLIEMAAEKFDVFHHSTIDACKNLCHNLGWDGEKDDKSRAMLSDLKQWYIKYFDGVMVDLKDDINWIQSSPSIGCDFFFVVTREGEEINQIKEWCKENGYECKYLFIRRGKSRVYGNSSDDNVLGVVAPDVFINNYGSLEDLNTSVNVLLDELLMSETDSFV